MSDFISETLTERFHYVRSMLPVEQTVISISPDATVAEALALLDEYDFLQLPVMEGNAVLGVFSYRSYALGLKRIGKLDYDPSELSVDEFVEQHEFIQPTSNWEQLLNHLDVKDAVLVGGLDNLHGVVTPMDVVRGLQRIASPFVLLAEIEQSLRRALRACVTEEELNACVLNVSKKPKELNEFNFGGYSYLIKHESNWPLFAPIFGTTRFTLESTLRRLEEIRQIRNAAFHFNRKIEEEDIATLTEHRDWLNRRIRAFIARQESVSKQDVSSLESVERWTEKKFFNVLAEQSSVGEVDVARSIYEWAKVNMPEIWWGKGKRYGSIIPGFTHNQIWHQLFGLWTNGYIELQFQYMQGKPPFDEEEKRRDLMQRLNQIDGFYINDFEIDKRPSLPLALLMDPKQLTIFFETASWFIETVRSSNRGQNDLPSLRYLFWSELLETASKVLTVHDNISPTQSSDIAAPAGVRGLNYKYFIQMEGAEIALDIARSNPSDNKRILNELASQKAAVEAAFGAQLEWGDPESNGNSYKISYLLPGSGLQDRARWPNMQQKMIEAMSRLSGALQPFINELKV